MNEHILENLAQRILGPMAPAGEFERVAKLLGDADFQFFCCNGYGGALTHACVRAMANRREHGGKEVVNVHFQLPGGQRLRIDVVYEDDQLMGQLVRELSDPALRVRRSDGTSETVPDQGHMMYRVKIGQLFGHPVWGAYRRVLTLLPEKPD